MCSCDSVCVHLFIGRGVSEPCYFSKWVPANVCDGWAGRFDSSSAPCSAQSPGSPSHLMKKRVDLLQVTDAENRLTQLGCTCPISCTTKAPPQVVDMRGESTRGIEDGCVLCTVYWGWVIQLKSVLKYLFLLISKCHEL